MGGVILVVLVLLIILGLSGGIGVVRNSRVKGKVSNKRKGKTLKEWRSGMSSSMRDRVNLSRRRGVPASMMHPRVSVNDY